MAASGKAVLDPIPTDNIAATTTDSTTPQLLTVGSTLVYPYKTWFGDLYKLMCVPVSHLSPFLPKVTNELPHPQAVLKTHTHVIKSNLRRRVLEVEEDMTDTLPSKQCDALPLDKEDTPSFSPSRMVAQGWTSWVAQGWTSWVPSIISQAVGWMTDSQASKMEDKPAQLTVPLPRSRDAVVFELLRQLWQHGIYYWMFDSQGFEGRRHISVCAEREFTVLIEYYVSKQADYIRECIETKSTALFIICMRFIDYTEARAQSQHSYRPAAVLAEVLANNSVRLGVDPDLLFWIRPECFCFRAR
jgi:hypothetical protein